MAPKINYWIPQKGNMQNIKSHFRPPLKYYEDEYEFTYVLGFVIFASLSTYPSTYVHGIFDLKL